MRKIILLLSLLLSLTVLSEAQRVYELSCAPGSFDMEGPTYNPSTQKFRSWLCVDALGNVSSPVFTAGAGMVWPATPGIPVCLGTPCAAWGATLPAPDGVATHFLNGSGAWSAGAPTVTLQTNGVNNLSQTALNLIDSSTNATGLTSTCANTVLGTVQCEVGVVANGGVQLTEGTGAGLTAGAGKDLLWPDSVAHRWKMNNNNSGATTIAATTGGLPGDWAVFAANGYDLADGGLPLQRFVAAGKGDAIIITDASTVNGTSTVTCPNSDCNFTSADVGKLIWVMNGSNLSIPQGTILSINSPQSVQASTVAVSSTTGTGVLIWGSDDTAALTNMWAAASLNCNTGFIGQGKWITQQAQFNSYTGCTTAYNQPGVTGQGKSATILILSPNFNYATCTPACFGGGVYSIFKGFGVFGYSYSPAACANKTLTENNGGFFDDVDLLNWCANQSGSVGHYMLGSSTASKWGGTQGAGALGIKMNSFNGALFNFISSTGIEVQGINNLSTNNNYANGVITVDAGGELISVADRGGTVNNSGKLTLDSFTAPGTTMSIQNSASGIINLRNTALPAATSGSYNGVSYLGTSSSLLNDEGGNSFAGIALPFVSISQAAYAQVASGTSVPKLWPVNPAANSLAVVQCADIPTTSNINTPTDTRGLIWTQIGAQLTTTTTFGTARNVAVFYAPDTAGGSDTVQCNFSGAVTYGAINLIEMDGTAQTTPLDGSATSSGSGTVVASSAQNTTVNGDIGFVLVYPNTAASFTKGTCTPLGTTCLAIPGGNQGIGTEYQIVPTASAQSMPGTLSINADWVGWWFNVKAFSTTPPISNFPKSGNCTFAGTTCTVTFNSAFLVPPNCSAGDQTAAAPVRTQPTTTQVVLTGGTGAGATDVVSWVCK